MEKPVLYRKRIIPDECILLKDDEILYHDDKIIVTKWNALHPKIHLHHGYSCYFLKEGFKISKFYKENNDLLYWYCDIIEPSYDSEKNAFTFVDLLADVIIYPDGFVKVVDLDEFVHALEQNSITVGSLKKALLSLDNLLKIIYGGDFDTLTQFIEARE